MVMEEIVFVCFATYCSIVPTRREELEQVVSGV